MRAFSMISGGLDSQLAVRVIQSQGIEVIGLHLFHRFHRAGEEGSWPDHEGLPVSAKTVLDTCAALGIEVVLRDFSDNFLDIANNPKHGRGKGFNPCLDCRIVMLRLAGDMMTDHNARFVFTGEVLGQRPMSQHKQGLEMVAKRSGLDKLLLRPLSARLLPKTIPEEMGWVRREELLSFQGRNRKPQMALAKELGINEYPMPAGGCFLTDPNLASRFYAWAKNLGQIGPREMTAFRIGRHFILPGGTYVIVGRDENENETLMELLSGSYHLAAKDSPGASVFLLQTPCEEDLHIAARLAVRYSDSKEKTRVAVEVMGPDDSKTVSVDPLENETLETLRL